MRLGGVKIKILSAAGYGASGETRTFTEYFAAFFTRPDLIPRLMNYLERLEVKAGFVLFETGRSPVPTAILWNRAR